MAAEIGPNSGALAPYDVELTSAKAAVRSPIIGKRDLRPILSHLNARARALVVLDACYSSESAKAPPVELAGQVRSLDLPIPLSASGLETELLGEDKPAAED